MQKFVEFLIAHGSVVLFTAVLLDQIGIPIPAAPILIAAGAMTHAGRLDGSMVALVCVLAAVISHAAWYEAGRLHGARVLQLVCRISLEPDACVRQTEDLFIRYGAKSLVIARFIPGFDVVSIPLAAMSRMRMAEFLAFDAIGLLIWLFGYFTLGWLFSDQLEEVAENALDLGARLGAVVIAALVAYVILKLVRRYRLIRSVRTARITPEELHRMMRLGTPLTVIDLRPEMELTGDRRIIAGAFRVDPDQLDERSHEIPRVGDIILYCG